MNQYNFDISKYENNLELAYNLYKTGDYSITKIAEKLDLNRKRLSRMLKDTYPDINIRKDGKKIVDSFAFDIIDTEEKAYWLGFLYADGYVSDGYLNHRVEIALKYSDYNHIIKFQKFLKSNHKINKKIIKKEDGKIFYSARLTIQDEHLCNSLRKYGCINNKSLIVQFPHFLDKNLMRHFIRGFFDGDGTLSKTKNEEFIIGFTSGSKDFLNELKKYLLDLGFWTTDLRQRHIGRENYTIYISRSQNKSFLTYLYQHSSISLNRKYELYLAALGQVTRSKPKRYIAELSGKVVKTLEELELDNPSPKADIE